ncbi:MAG: FMN-binding protein [Bacteroidetes bacterium]|nr:FMN-binding protein [Bacteroidota bacterium]
MKKIIFVIAILLFSSGFTISKRVEALIKKEITSVFDIETYTKQTLTVLPEINETLPIEITDANFFKIINNEETIGYYYFGQAYGKADYFDFIVIFDKNLIVSKVKVLVYREDHGGEVGSKRWLKQFIGVTTEKHLKYQDDIVGISGATISVKSMTNAVNKLLKTVHILQTKNQL